MNISDSELKKMAKVSNRTALLSAMGFLLVLGSMFYSAYRLTKLQKEVEKLDQDLASKEKLVKVLNDSLQASTFELERINHSLNRSRDAAEVIRKGINHYQRGEFLAAILSYNKALKIDSSNYVVYDWLGYAYFRNGQLPEAIRALRYSIMLSPKYARGYYNLALALWRSGDRNGGIEAIKSAIEISPDLRATVRSDGQFAPFRQSKEFRTLIEQ